MPSAAGDERTRFVWRPRASRRRGRLTLPCCSRPPASLATDTTSPRCSGSRRRRRSRASLPRSGCCSVRRCTSSGGFDEAERVLEGAEASAAEDDPLLVPIVELHTRNLMWGLSLPDEALAHNRAMREQLRAHPAGDELALNEAMLLTYSGRPLEILRVLEAAPDSIDAARSLPPGPCGASCARRDRPVRDRCCRCAPGVRRATRAARTDRDPDAGSASHHEDVRARGERPTRRCDRSRHRRVRGDPALRPARRVRVARTAARPVRPSERAGRDRMPVAR